MLTGHIRPSLPALGMRTALPQAVNGPVAWRWLDPGVEGRFTGTIRQKKLLLNTTMPNRQCARPPSMAVMRLSPTFNVNSWGPASWECCRGGGRSSASWGSTRRSMKLCGGTRLSSPAPIWRQSSRGALGW